MRLGEPGKKTTWIIFLEDLLRTNAIVGRITRFVWYAINPTNNE